MFHNQIFNTTVSPSFTVPLEIELFHETGYGSHKKRVKTDNINLTTLPKNQLRKLKPIIEESSNDEIAKLNYLSNQLNEAKNKKFHVKGSDQNAIYLGFLSRIKIKEQKIQKLEECLDYVANNLEKFEEYSEEN